jgi:HAD superfamily hydrolase (TIGR01509 family)
VVLKALSSSVPGYKAVFFDFAGTLFSDRALRDVHLDQLHFVAAAIGARGLTDAELRAAYRQGMGVAFRTVAAFPCYLHRDLFAAAFVHMAKALGGELDDAAAQQAVDRQHLATAVNAVLRPGCLPTVAALRAAGLHVGIVSNIDAALLDDMVERLQLAAAVDAWTSSEEAGSCKPDPGIYHHAMRKAGCDPSGVLFVGDSVSHDIEGPAALGMRTAWLVADAKPGRGEAHPDFVIETLSEVLGIVNGAQL